MALTGSENESDAVKDNGMILRDETASMERSKLDVRLAWLIIGLGIIFHLYLYTVNRSLWLDEAYIVEGIITRSWSDLLTPLPNNQAAPLGFVAVEVAVTQALGTSEYALRLFPLLCGVLTLPLFYLLARRVLDGYATHFALAVVAFSPRFAYYSSDVKPYAGDALFATACLLAAVWYFDNPRSFRRLMVLTGAGAVALWFSYPAAFVLGGTGAAMLVGWLRLPDRRTMGRDLLVVAVFWGVSFLVHYRIWMAIQVTDEFLVTFWDHAFLPFPPWSGAALKWLFHLPFQVLINPTGFVYPGVACGFLIVGLLVFVRSRSLSSLTVLLPVGLLLLASAIEKYPAWGRLLVFALPVIALLLGAGVGLLLRAAGTRHRLLAVCMVGIAMLPLLYAAGKQAANPFREELRPVVAWVQNNSEPDDVIYVYHRAQYALRYYIERDRHLDWRYVAGDDHREDLQSYLDEVDRFRGEERVWLIFTEDAIGGARDKALLLLWLDRHGVRLDAIEMVGASAYLYDFSRMPPRPEKDLETVGANVDNSS